MGRSWFGLGGLVGASSSRARPSWEEESEHPGSEQRTSSRAFLLLLIFLLAFQSFREEAD